MTWQDMIAALSFGFAIAGLIFALGKQAQSILTNRIDINHVGQKLDIVANTSDNRLDEIARFTIRVDQRVANLERQVYGDNITEILRSGNNFRPNSNDDDTIPNL